MLIPKEAFEKGLFKTDKACYTQAFIPHSHYRIIENEKLGTALLMAWPIGAE